MADDEDDLYVLFGDFLHEVPEAEEALREWRRKQAIEAVRKQERERHRRDVEEAIAWFGNRRK